ncbi:MAG TPA: fumarylacetoacetate hydrolase family protein [Sphaerochaeta sp.]|nr:fumarylacetoacetate hydrolase family protein [Sphaerochaeta sp.]
MQYVRILAGESPRYGVLAGEEIRLLENTPFADELIFSDQCVEASEATYLAPSLFSKAVCVGLNYRDHAKELGLPVSEAPVLFLKPSTAILDPNQSIITPEACTRLDYEGELAIVIKRRAHRVSAADANEYILGYSCANDVTARNLQDPKGQWTVAKSFDTFCPYGPVIQAGIDPSDLVIETRLNTVVKQRSTTAELLFDVPTLVSYISSVMTLLPGDIILTGTPSGIGPMQAGDTVEVYIEKVGTLSNSVC